MEKAPLLVKIGGGAAEPSLPYHSANADAVDCDTTSLSKRQQRRVAAGGALLLCLGAVAGTLQYVSTADKAPKQQLAAVKKPDFSVVSSRVNYNPVDSKTLKAYRRDAIFEPDVGTVVTLSACADEAFANDEQVRTTCADLHWTVIAVTGDGHIEGTSTVTTSTGPSLSAVFTPANAEFKVEAAASDGTVVATLTGITKYVRREIRQLRDEDREAYFAALKIMWTTTQEDGEALYGKSFISHAHLVALHNSDVYAYHTNLFFLTSHPVMQLKMEKGLLAINPNLVLPYWDFLLDESLGRDWASGKVYQENWFGPVKTSAEDSYRVPGWKDIKKIYDPDWANFPNAYHTPYGFLGSTMDFSTGEYYQRSNSYCGFESIQGQTTCSHVQECFMKLESTESLYEFDMCMETKVHGNLHLMHAGQWDCSVSWSDFYDEQKGWLDEMLFSILGVHSAQGTVKLKESGYLLCEGQTEESTCSMDEDCSCISTLENVASASDVDTKLTAEQRFEIMEEYWDFIAAPAQFATSLVQEYTYTVNGVDYKCPVPLYPSGENSGKPVTWEELDLLNSLLLKTQLFPGTTGLMTSGAAANDPLFWVMHQMFDKALHVLRLSAKYNKNPTLLEWDNAAGKMTWTGETPFKSVDFEPYLGEHKPENSDGFLTNDMLWALLEPDSNSLPYVYDQLSTWGDCSYDAMGDGDEDESLLQESSTTAMEDTPLAKFAHVMKNAEMPLVGDVGLSLLDTTSSTSSMYYCLSYAPEPEGEKDELWTPWEQLEDGNLDTKIFRLRPMHTYTVKLWVRTAAGEVSMQDTVQYDVGSSGVWQFDEGPLAKTVFGSPNWELIMTDYAVGDSPDADNYDAFGGNIIFDEQGWVVWMYDAAKHGMSGTVQTFTKMQSRNNMLGLASSSPFDMFEFTPLGETVHDSSIACEDAHDSYEGYRGISHEIREDGFNAGEVLTLPNKLVAVEGLDNLQAVDGIAVWNTTTGELDVKYWLNDYLDISVARGVYSDTSVVEGCAQQYDADDWSHANSLYGTTNSYIVSARSLDAVIGFARDGTGIQWILSSDTHVNSDFTFVPPDSGFWNQHDVTVMGETVENGKTMKMVIAVMDNGDSRPNCMDTWQNCYSKGAEYELDFTTWTATLIWEFRPQHEIHGENYLYSLAKGSVSKNGDVEDSRVVAFDSVIWDGETTDEADNDSSQFIYEIDNIRGEPFMRSLTTLPTVKQTGWSYPYRAVHVSHVAGEKMTMHAFAVACEEDHDCETSAS